MFPTPWLAGLTLLWLTALSTAPHPTDVPKPMDVNHPEREPRYLALSEAIALSLENAVLGLRSFRSLVDFDAYDLLGDPQFPLTPRTDSVKILSQVPVVFETITQYQSRVDVTMRVLAQFSTSPPDCSQNQSTTVSDPTAFQGILVARQRFDQTRAELEGNVSALVVNVETAYWNLYGAFVNLYSSEQGLRQAYEVWRISKAKYEAGSTSITEFAQTRGQYEQFRGDRLAALEQVLEAERVLRHLIGLPVEDGKRLVPVDAPTLTPYVPEWHAAVNEALELRPELILARTELKNRQLEMIRVKNQLMPRTTYQLTGLGTRLDGDGVLQPETTGVMLTGNALQRLAADAQVRQAQLRLAQGYQEMKDQEIRAVNFVEQQMRTIVEKYAVIQARRAQRVAFAEQIETRFKEFVTGKTTADFLLEAQRQWAAALSSEYQEVVNYNNALARFHFAKGTLLQHDSVLITEGNLPQEAQVKATETERKRSQALVLRERLAPVLVPTNAATQNCSPLPQLPATSAPLVPSLVSGAPPVPDGLTRNGTIFSPALYLIRAEGNAPCTRPLRGRSH